MKPIYTYVKGNKIEYIPTGGGHQRILVWFEDGNDWFVYFCDDLLSKTYIHKVINKTLNPIHIFNMENLETLDEESFSKYIAWIDSNYNYQGLHKNEKLDG